MDVKKTQKTTRMLVLTAILVAIAIIIPMYFGFLKIVIPPYFTATIAAHVPQFIAMFISPTVAVAVGVGSALGFLPAYGPVVALRATSHIVWGFLGAKMMQKRKSFLEVILVTGLVHGIYEGLIIMPFLAKGNKLTVAAVAITAIGTFVHHLVDAAIGYSIGVPLKLINKDGKKHQIA